jgi:hypothetical protein
MQEGSAIRAADAVAQRRKSLLQGRASLLVCGGAPALVVFIVIFMCNNLY